MPDQIDIDCGIGRYFEAENQDGSPLIIHNNTSLFRVQTNIPTALEVYKENNGLESDCVIYNPASSIGAEAYSILSVLEHDGYDATATVIALDPVAKNLRAVLRGAYQTRRSFAHEYADDDFYIEDTLQTLKTMGFEADVIGNRSFFGLKTHTKPGQRDISVGTANFRRRHNIRTELGVMLDTPDFIDPHTVNCAFINNIIYYLTAEEASHSLVAVARTIKTGGVLSIGEANTGVMRSAFSNSSDIRYDQWHEKTIEDLKKEGLVPANLPRKIGFAGAEKLTTIFVRE